MKLLLKRIYCYSISPLNLVVVILAALGAFVFKSFKKNGRIALGSTPILNYSYWCRLLRENGYETKSFVSGVFDINSATDWDFILNEKMKLIPRGFREFLCFSYVIMKFDFIVTSCDGFLIGGSNLWKLQYWLFKMAKCKSIVFTYGGDSYVYRNIRSSVVQHALLLSYPNNGRRMQKIQKNVDYWVRCADIFIPGMMGVEGFGRWDIPIPTPVQIDLDVWKTKKVGKNIKNKDKIVFGHSSNHRGFKGTEIIINTVEALIQEGYPIELVLIENLNNLEVREIYSEKIDVLIDQILCPGYGLSALEGMACSLPVLSNIPHGVYTDFMRIWSFLDEVPIISTNFWNLKSNIINLVENREQISILGDRSRKFVEKYHGSSACKIMFDAIFEKLRNPSFDLMNLHSPQKKIM